MEMVISGCYCSFECVHPLPMSLFSVVIIHNKMQRKVLPNITKPTLYKQLRHFSPKSPRTHWSAALCNEVMDFDYGFWISLCLSHVISFSLWKMYGNDHFWVLFWTHLCSFHTISFRPFTIHTWNKKTSSHQVLPEIDWFLLLMVSLWWQVFLVIVNVRQIPAKWPENCITQTKDTLLTKACQNISISLI